MNELPHMDMGEVRRAAHDLGLKRRDARRDYERYVQQAAEAERTYHQKRAKAFAKAKLEGTVAQAELEANAAAAEDRYKRDIAQGMMKSALLRIEELEADRAMLRQLGDWSQRMEEVTA